MNVIVLEDGYESANVLVFATHSSDKQWIMDLGCSFHMTPNKDWFKNCNKAEDGHSFAWKQQTLRYNRD